MGAFDDLLSQGAPEPEVHIFLPTKLGTADKGGDATQAAVAAAGKPADSQSPTSTSGPEPEPQLPEGSDPDEPDTAEDDAADTAAVAAAAREMFLKPQPASGTASDAGLAPDADLAGETEEESGNPSDQPGDIATGQDHPQPVIPKKGGGLTFEGESASLKQFPKVLIDEMRRILGVQLNEVFARDISQVSIVTAFAMAVLGTEVTVDETTSHAVRAFKASDPRTDALDSRTARLLEKQSTTEGMLKALLAGLREVTETTAVLEMGQAYALAERTAQLDTSGTVPENINVTQKRAVAARDNIRTRVKKQRQDEKIRDGRPIR